LKRIYRAEKCGLFGIFGEFLHPDLAGVASNAQKVVHTPDGVFGGTVGHELFTNHILIRDFHAKHFWTS
jgi:hypothetical protein